MKLNFDVTKQEFEIIRDILQKNVPSGCEVWVFGSRAKNQARFNSDIDLAVEGQAAVPARIMQQLKEDFSESRLPYKVDVLDINDIDDNFKSIIEQQRILFPLGDNQKVPALRFPEFSAEWEETRIDKLAKVSIGLVTTMTENYVENGVFLIRNSDIKVNGVKKTGLINLSHEFANQHENRKLRKNDIVTVHTGDVGVSAIIDSRLDGSHGFATLNTRIFKESNLSPYYLCTFFNRHKFWSWSISMSTGDGRQNLNLQDFKKACIIYPTDIKEQQKIASFLSSVDKKIEQLTKKKQLLEQYKKGMMQQLFSQHIRFKDEGGNDYPDWEEKKLGGVAEFTSSKRVYLSDYVDQGIPFYRGKEISELRIGIKPSDILYISEERYEDYKEKYGVPLVNDILITAVGTLGNVLRIKNDDKFYFKDGNLIWLRKISQNPDYLECLLQWHTKDLIKTSIGSTQKALTMVELRKLVFPFPSLPEQTKIAHFLSAIDDKINLIETELNHAQTFKKGLLQQMFV